MNIHEYQAKELYRKVGLPTTPVGAVCHTVEEVVAATEAAGSLVVIKAQVHTGGRGKAGGVKLAHRRPRRRVPQAEKHPGPARSRAHTVRKVLVADPRSDIGREAYLSHDARPQPPRRHRLIMACAEGGMDIEELVGDRTTRRRRSCASVRTSLTFPEAEAARPVAAQHVPRRQRAHRGGAGHHAQAVPALRRAAIARWWRSTRWS
jgi:succinyl-CoA synthetase beta subunit